jgi:hypothetical protein
MLYQGTCASTCLGCFGPNATDCYMCIENAFHNSETGACECLPEYYGQYCKTTV